MEVELLIALPNVETGPLAAVLILANLTKIFL